MDQDNNKPAGNSSTIILIGGIILVAVLAVLGWYMLQGQGGAGVALPSTETSQTQTPLTTEESDVATEALSAQGTSDETTAIEADLNMTDLNSLNDINQI